MDSYLISKTKRVVKRYICVVVFVYAIFKGSNNGRFTIFN